MDVNETPAPTEKPSLANVVLAFVAVLFIPAVLLFSCISAFNDPVRVAQRRADAAMADAYRLQQQAEIERLMPQAKAAVERAERAASAPASAPPVTSHLPVGERSLPSQRIPMSFSACVRRIGAAATELGTAPINIVETNSIRVVRFNTATGSVIITCDGEYLVMIDSPHRG